MHFHEPYDISLNDDCSAQLPVIGFIWPLLIIRTSRDQVSFFGGVLARLMEWLYSVYYLSALWSPHPVWSVSPNLATASVLRISSTIWWIDWRVTVVVVVYPLSVSQLIWWSTHTLNNNNNGIQHTRPLLQLSLGLWLTNAQCSRGGFTVPLRNYCFRRREVLNCANAYSIVLTNKNSEPEGVCWLWWGGAGGGLDSMRLVH